MESPVLSVIVTVVEGGAALTRCLEALSGQVDPPALEVIVPFDQTIGEVADLAGRFPEVRFLDLGPLSEGGPPATEFERHVLYDRRRSGGLRAARGRYLAMLEDRGWPRPDWARQMMALHEASPAAAVGGAVESGAVGPLLWAAYFCDFGRYQPPLEEDDADYLTDINICYTRAALERQRPLWQTRYQEVEVNWALKQQGERLLLSDKPVVVQQRAPVGLGQALSERVHWGRTFGRLRAQNAPRSTCLLWAAATPLLPALLFLRHFRQRLAKGQSMGAFLRAGPAIFLLLHFWALGEFIGYGERGFGPRPREA